VSSFPITTQQIFECVELELSSTRKNWPGNEDMTVVFCEETGELCKAMLDTKQKNGPHEDVFKEAIQSIAMIIRLVQEGDPSFPYKCKEEFYLKEMNRRIRHVVVNGLKRYQCCMCSTIHIWDWDARVCC